MSVTPGPWLMDKEPTFSLVNGTRTGRLALSIHADGENGRPLIRVGARTDDEAEVRANARLVCAAPIYKAARDSLFDAIKHGDAEHQAWLRLAIDAHFAAADQTATPEPHKEA